MPKPSGRRRHNAGKNRLSVCSFPNGGFVVLLTMQLKERKSCPLCRSESITLFKPGTIDPQSITSDDFKITDSNYGSLWTFYKCRKCRFVFFNPYVPDEDIVEFYAQLKDEEYGSEAEGRSKNFRTLLNRLKRLTPGNTLLDVGAAGGIFVNLAQTFGYEAEGIEPSEFLCAEATKHYGLSLFNGTVESFQREKPDAQYAVVTLLDIIEHLTDPAGFMQAVDALLAENGLLVIVTPDIDSLAARLMGKRWWHYRIAHINFFNLTSLRFLLDKFGYRIEMKKKYVWNFTLFYLLSRLFPGLKNEDKPETTLQKFLKKVHLKLPLFDSWEIYAKKSKTNKPYNS